LGSWHVSKANFSNPAIFVPAFKQTLLPTHFIQVSHDVSIHVGRVIGTSQTSQSNQNAMDSRVK
jgi:hypothetical protein